MNLSHIAAISTGVALAFFPLAFGVSSYRERKIRAVCISFGMALIIVALLAIDLMWQQLPDGLLYIFSAVVWVIALLYFLPFSKPSAIEIGTITEKVDERDTMFAREEYRFGTNRYSKYYAEHPQYKEVDDRLRQLPEILEQGGRYYDPERAQNIKAIFRAIQTLTTQVDGEVNPARTGKDPSTTTSEIKELVTRLGADEVGIARLNKMFIYSHVGRGPEPWGEPIKLDHEFAVVFTLEMDYGQVQKAPDLPTTEESALQYLRSATISVNLARYIRNLGYPARAHISDSNYQIMLPPVACDAGLGELSRMGYLISRKYGARVRLGSVTTDLSLIADKPVAFGVQDFCSVCLKCAKNCPAAAIPYGDKTPVRGVQKWPLNTEKCLRYWRLAGTDCGLCMRVCPYSHPPTFVHRVVRTGIKHSAIARRISIWGDNFFYGRKVSLKKT